MVDMLGGDADVWMSPAAQRTAKLLEGLTEQQRASVEHRGSPLVILAGAGTGKTTALTRRIAHIITTGDARPEQILAVTFTNKAARELEKRIKRLLDDELSGLTVGTFHAVCARILRDNAELFGVSKDYTIMDADDQKRLVKRLGKARYGKDGTAKELVDEVMGLIENVRGNPDEGLDILLRAPQDTRNIYEDYQEAKKADGILDFTDLLSIVTEAFREGWVDPTQIAGKWTHILVDEYQDTNGLQFEWLQHVVGDKPDLAVVGDDDQVLYSWRGARIENMLSFQDKFPGTKLIRLEENFRSTGLILKAANGLIARNKKRLGKTLVTKDVPGKPIQVRWFVNAEMEARWIVDEIKTYLADGTDPTEIAILSRASHALNIVEQQLTWAGIPFVLSGGKRFQDKAEIRDAMAYLRLAANPNDTTAFDRVVNTPKRGMGEASIKKIIDATERARKSKIPLSLLDIADNFARSRALPGDVPGQLLDFVEAIRKANTAFWRGADASQLLDLVLEVSGYRAAMATALAEAKSHSEGNLAESLQVRTDNLADLIKLGQGMTPIQLVEHLGLSEDGRSRNATGVWVGTIHAAKGLEWPVVFGVAWEENVLPSWQALQEEGEIKNELVAEERRCAYVEITRARKHLTLTATGERFAKPATRSRFLNDLPPGTFVKYDMQPPEQHEDDQPARRSNAA